MQQCFVNGQARQREGSAELSAVWECLMLHTNPCCLAGVACSIILYLLASGDMFYTARYFHPQFESLLAAACTAAFFKYPLFLFCSWTGLTGKLAE